MFVIFWILLENIAGDADSNKLNPQDKTVFWVSNEHHNGEIPGVLHGALGDLYFLVCRISYTIPTGDGSDSDYTGCTNLHDLPVIHQGEERSFSSKTPLV